MVNVKSNSNRNLQADNPNLDLNYYCAESFRCNGNITNIMCNTELVSFASAVE